ncbi:hypothetical protein [Paenibacillus anaericanus]|uniref:hypothetical protein n=1 Tax=Paenibacillus anaericanus TaxID=170367 RepID=UPI0027D7EF46|nr:hypothetical protein [Paenibacillus anaericanus]
MQDELILTIELIPRSSWDNNLRSALTPWQWHKLCKYFYESVNHTCEICGAIKGEEFSRMYCHEVWEYNEDTKIQKLVRLEVLCFKCHAVKHFGLSEALDWIDEKTLIKHFININGVNKKFFHGYYEDCFEVWRKRNNIDWIVDVGDIESKYADVIMYYRDKRKLLFERVSEANNKDPKIKRKELFEMFKGERGIHEIVAEVKRESKLRRKQLSE